MRWLRIYIVVMILILGLYLLAEYSRVPELDWRPTLSSHDKIPYGTWIVYHELGALYDQKPDESRRELYTMINDSEDSGVAWIMVEHTFDPGKAAEKELLKYIARGNILFLSTENLSKSLADTLKLKIEPNYFVAKQKDSTRIRLVNPQLDSTKMYTMQNGTIDAYIRSFDTTHYEVLGDQANHRVNFIRIPFGEGVIFLHTAPLMFSNYSLLQHNNLNYVENVLSYVPMEANQVYWDEYYKIGAGESDSPLRVFLTHKNLKWAWFTALATLVLFLMFAVKRRQRIIPVVAPPVNASLDFVGTIANVYFNGKDHYGIAVKRMGYWLDGVRQRYGLNTSRTDAEFIRVLAAKSGVDPDLVKDLAEWCAALRDGAQVGEKELLTFSTLIDEFQKTSIS